MYAKMFYYMDVVFLSHVVVELYDVDGEYVYNIYTNKNGPRIILKKTFIKYY